jgi:hypothetical protein
MGKIQGDDYLDRTDDFLGPHGFNFRIISSNFRRNVFGQWQCFWCMVSDDITRALSAQTILMEIHSGRILPLIMSSHQAREIVRDKGNPLQFSERNPHPIPSDSRKNQHMKFGKRSCHIRWPYRISQTHCLNLKVQICQLLYCPWGFSCMFFIRISCFKTYLTTTKAPSYFVYDACNSYNAAKIEGSKALLIIIWAS